VANDSKQKNVSCILYVSIPDPLKQGHGTKDG